MKKTKFQAAFARLCNYCKKRNEVAQAETKRRAKIAWITREIEKFDEGKLNRVIVTINQVKD
nr:hypothetical protein [uncultured Campylobacter sp.]